ncbi:MAG: hypothetical protein JXP34_10235 [Planctomycetes bacterium]|nr:hypothetical protein [Planctomycetota bacterium]
MRASRIRAVVVAAALVLPTPDRGTRAADVAAAAIRVDPAAEAGPPISRRLFGKFTEHLGRNIYGGMWAQILRNPGFERSAYFGRRERGRLQGGEGIALAWRALSDAPCTFRPTEDCAIAGQTAQSIEADAIGDRPAGIRQDGIDLPLHRESDYRLSLRARGSGVAAGFTATILEGDRALASAEFAPPAAAWERREAILTIPRGSIPRGTPLAIEIRLRAPGRLDLDLVELFPCDATGGLDPDVVDFMRRARVALLRYPGGNFVSGYHWRDGIGPRERRPIRRNEPWDMAEYNHMGTDEFLRFCEICGCEPMICVNAGDGTPEEAADWVAYANDPVATPLGALRARNGHPAPYGVRYWEIGNELYGDWQIGHTTAEGYAERYARFLAAMRAADPTIECVANGHDAAWNRTLLERCGSSVRSISAHPLIGGGVARDADPDAVFRALMAYPTLFEAETRRLLDWARARGLSPRIAVTELQIFTNRPELPNNASLAEALWLGRFIHAAIRSKGTIECITHSALVNHGGGLRKERAVVYANPVWAAQELYGTMSGVRPVAIEVDCQTFRERVPGVPAGAPAPVIDAVALRDGAGEDLTLIAIHLDPRRPIEARIRIAGPRMRAIGARRIEAPSTMARNSFAQPDLVRLREIPPPLAEDGTVTLPPHSITEIVFRPEEGGPR